jgi:hypothetical protein
VGEGNLNQMTDSFYYLFSYLELTQDLISGYILETICKNVASLRRVGNIYFIETGDWLALPIAVAVVEEDRVQPACTQYWGVAEGSAVGVDNDNQESDYLWRTYTVCMRCHNATEHPVMNMPLDLSQQPNQQ